MEIVIALFLGGWLTASAVLGYKQLQKDFGYKKDKEAGR